MASFGKEETRTCIKFCVNLGYTPTQTIEKLQTAKIGNKACRSLVFKWHKRFREGRESNKDNDREGRKSVISTALVTSIRETLDNDRRVTIHELADAYDVSYGTVWTVIHDHLNMRRVCARWVPRLLKEEERERRVADSRKFLHRHARDPTFLDTIITVDETWLWLYDPETKQQSSMWKRASSPPPKKARVNKSGGKFMFIMFADRRGMILNHVVPEHGSINSEYYSKVNDFVIII